MSELYLDSNISSRGIIEYRLGSARACVLGDDRKQDDEDRILMMVISDPILQIRLFIIT